MDGKELLTTALVVLLAFAAGKGIATLLKRQGMAIAD